MSNQEMVLLTKEELHQLIKSKVMKAGLPQEYAEMIVSFSEAIEQGEFEAEDTDLERLLGRKPTSIFNYLKQVYLSM